MGRRPSFPKAGAKVGELEARTLRAPNHVRGRPRVTFQPTTRRWAITALLSILTLVLAHQGPTKIDAQVRAPHERQAVSVDQLKAAVLSPEDLGPDFYVADEASGDNPPELIRFMVSRPGGPAGFPVLETPVHLIIIMAEDATTDLSVIVDGTLAQVRDEYRGYDLVFSDQMDANWIYPGGIAFEAAGTVGSGPVLIASYTWRQGATVVSILAIVRATGGVEEAATAAATYAVLQRDKLIAVLGTSNREFGGDAEG